MNQHEPIQDRKEIISITLLLALHVGIRYIYLVGVGWNDDVEYASSANLISLSLTGQKIVYPFESIDSLRFLVILPIALIYLLFNSGFYQAILWPLLCSMSTLILLYFFSKQFLSKEDRILCCLLFSLFPLEMIFATQIVPSTIMMPFILGGSLVLYKLDFKERWMQFAAGIIFGTAYLANIRVVPFVLIPLSMIGIQHKRKFLQPLLYFLMGFACPFLGDSLFHLFRTGDFWFRLKIIYTAQKTAYPNTDMSYYPRILFKVIKPDFYREEGHVGWWSYYFLMAYGVLAYHIGKSRLWSRRGSEADSGAWFGIGTSVLVIMLFFQYGRSSIEGALIAKYARYLIPLIPFVVLFVVFTFSRFFSTLIKVTLYGWVLLTSLFYLHGTHEAAIAKVNQYLCAREYFLEHPQGLVLADGPSHGYLYSYFGYQNRFVVLPAPVPQDFLKSIDDVEYLVLSSFTKQIPEYLQNFDWQIQQACISGESVYFNKEVLRIYQRQNSGGER